MLPFLYSANPYFELLKVSTLPSLDQQDFGFAIYNASGKLIFNPNRISSGITPELVAQVNRSVGGIWLPFTDKDTNYDAFYFQNNRRVYSLFIPRKNVMGLSVEVLKLLVFYIALALLGPPHRARPPRRRETLSRAVVLCQPGVCGLHPDHAPLAPPLHLFLTQLFQPVFAQRFIEKAEIHANFARNVMQDFIFLQQEEGATLIAPTDDIVLWISSAITTTSTSTARGASPPPAGGSSTTGASCPSSSTARSISA